MDIRQDLGILRQRPFLLLFTARSISLLGDAIVPVSLAFAILQLPHGSASELGLVLAVRYVAQIAFLLFGGVIADRWPRSRVMLSADIIAGFTQIVIAALFITGHTSLPVLLAATALNGAAAALFLPASKGFVPQVVPKESLQSANALLRVSMNTASIGGASLAGVLVVLGGPGWALAVDASTFMVSALLLSLIRVSGGTSTRGERSTLFADVKQGWAEFTSRRWIWMTVAQFGIVCACFNAGIRVLGPIVAKEDLGGPAAWAGILAAQSIGLVGGSLIAIRVRPKYPMRVAGYATFGFVPCFFLLGIGAPAWLVGLSLLVNGICADLFEVLWETSLQTHVTPEALSRVSSYEALGNYAFGPVGLMLAGPVSASLGVGDTLIGCGILLVLVNVAVCVSGSIRSVAVTAGGGSAIKVASDV